MSRQIGNMQLMRNEAVGWAVFTSPHTVISEPENVGRLRRGGFSGRIEVVFTVKVRNLGKEATRKHC